MVRQMLIKLRCHLSNDRNPCPGDHREVMVLGMVPNVHVEEIARAQVIVGFEAVLELVVLGNGVPCAGMQACDIHWLPYPIPKNVESSTQPKADAPNVW
jgi:hypothetical protein